jgi:hypothetical protein
MPTNSTQMPQARILNVTDIKSQRRVPRKPRHTWNVKAKPYEIVPIMFAPTLPGETLQDMLMQSRVVSDPIVDPLIGWFQEYYFVHVTHRALHAWDTTGLLQSMMLDPATSTAALHAAANNVPYYTFKGGMDWQKKITELIVEEWFRDEGETPATASIENYFAAQMDTDNWTQSFKLESAGADDPELPGVDEIEELDILPGFSTQYAQWELMRDQGMTDLTYEDFLRSYGVNIPKAEEASPEEKYKPELIRHFRKWSYPSNTIDPASGTPASAVYWEVAERSDKKRFFKEPGFIVGFSVTRPKLYMGNQKGAAIGMLKGTYEWLPAVLQGYPYTSVIETLDTLTDGVLQNQTQDYWIDVKDLFLHGDQFLNRTLAHAVALPTAAGVTKYPTEAMIDTLFVTAGAEYVRQDGVAFLNILSRMTDTTP